MTKNDLILDIKATISVSEAHIRRHGMQLGRLETEIQEVEQRLAVLRCQEATQKKLADKARGALVAAADILDNLNK